jgi:hypothetical protein
MSEQMAAAVEDVAQILPLLGVELFENVESSFSLDLFGVPAHHSFCSFG